jgi:hypothetical protein
MAAWPMMACGTCPIAHISSMPRAMSARGARERDTPASFTPDVLASFEREPKLIDLVALHLLDRHFAPVLHEEILEAVGLELGIPVATRRCDMAFRAAVLEGCLAECCVGGFSLRLVDGLIGVDAAHIRWHAHGGPDEVPNGLALCALHHRLFDHGPSRCARTCGCGSHGLWRGARHGLCSRTSMASQYGCRSTSSTTRAANTSAGTMPRFSRGRCDVGRNPACWTSDTCNDRGLEEGSYSARYAGTRPAVLVADWPISAVPRSGALVYTVWNRSGQLIYVGMAGRGESS